jgi:hypothetical protein
MKELHAWIERYFPCSFERGSSLLVIVGIFSTLLYVYTRIAFKGELRDLPQNVMVLTFLISAWGQRHRLKSDLVFKLLLLAMLIPWLLFGINVQLDYETAIKYRSVNDLLKLFLFLPSFGKGGGSILIYIMHSMGPCSLGWLLFFVSAVSVSESKKSP